MQCWFEPILLNLVQDQIFHVIIIISSLNSCYLTRNHLHFHKSILPEYIITSPINGCLIKNIWGKIIICTFPHDLFEADKQLNVVCATLPAAKINFCFPWDITYNVCVQEWPGARLKNSWKLYWTFLFIQKMSRTSLT